MECKFHWIYLLEQVGRIISDRYDPIFSKMSICKPITSRTQSLSIRSRSSPACISRCFGRVVGPRWWLAIIMAASAAMKTAQAAMSTPSQMYACRCLLAVFEAGYVPTAYAWMLVTDTHQIQA